MLEPIIIFFSNWVKTRIEISVGGLRVATDRIIS